MIKKLIDLAQDFHNETLKKYGRYRSWHYCYRLFSQARNKTNNDVDFLAVHLGFYLASWGMYRGSGFLLKQNYKINIPIVEEILKSEYDVLLDTDCFVLESNLNLLMKLSDWIRKFYLNNVKDIYTNKGKAIKGNASDTLVTKILMGTLGCCPAYDDYLQKTLGYLGFSEKFNQQSMQQIINFYKENMKELEKFRNKKENKIDGLKYPQMKVIDMAFWEYGFETDNKK